MNPELTLKITNDNLNIFQQIYAAATNEVLASIAVSLVIALFVVIILSYITPGKNKRSNTAHTDITAVITFSILLTVALYMTGTKYVKEGYYTSEKVTVTDIQEHYTDTVESKYTGADITYIKDKQQYTLRTYPHDEAGNVKVSSSKSAIEMAKDAVKKGDTIVVRTPKTYLEKDMPRSISKKSKDIDPYIQVVNEGGKKTQ